MLKKVPAPIKGTLNAIFLALHTIFWCLPMYFFFIIKLLAPTQRLRSATVRLLVKIANCWIRTNNLWMDVTLDTKLVVPDFSHLKLNDWYFLICNHQSWTDILILHRIFLNKIPFIRFFIKRELLFLPFLGIAWWVYDFPIMRRYSKQKLDKNPSLKGKDILATKVACQKYQHFPVTILNFLEGTRFTPEKHRQQSSEFQTLLMPKLGGFSYAISAMDQKIRHVIDVTIVYPYGRPNFWDFLCGRVKQITVHVKEFDIPDHLLQWESLEDESKRNLFRDWVNEIWKEKDKTIQQLTNYPS